MTTSTLEYNQDHARVRHERGLASARVCKCGRPALDWANLTGTYADVMDYEAMCRSCHKLLDMTDETRAKMSASRTGVLRGPHTLETRAAIAVKLIGNSNAAGKRSDEFREKMRAAMLGNQNARRTT